MSRKSGQAASNSERDDPSLPAHIVVLIVVLVLVFVGGGGALAYFSFFAPPQAHPTPVVQASVTVKATTPTGVPTRSKPTAVSSPTHSGGPATGSQPNPYPPHTGNLVLSDPLKDNSRGYQWDVGPVATGSTCGFAGGSYHITITVPRPVLDCNAEKGTFANFTYEVQMTILTGNRGGIFFRQAGVQGPYDAFLIRTNGSYELVSFDGHTSRILLQGTSPAIKTALKQANVLAVVAQGSSLTIYVNHQSLGTASDTATTAGLIGLAVDATAQPSDVAFANANVWAL